MARDFDPASSQALTVADNAALDLTAVTLSAWVRPDTLATTDIRIVLAKANRTGDPGNYELHLRNGSSAGSAGVWLVWYNGGFRWLNTTSNAAVTTGAWQHVAAGYDGTAKKIWVGGASLPLTDSSGGAALLTNSETLDIGRRQILTPANELFDGLIAEVAVWSVVLTDAEAAMLGRGASPLSVRPGSLAGYWPLYGRGSAEPELVNGLSASPVNGPAAADHPPVRRAWSAGVSFLPAASAVTVNYATETGAGQRAVLDTPWSFTTTTGSRVGHALDEGLTFTTEVDLLAAAGGTIEAPPGVGPFEFETVTGVVTTADLSPPVLLSFTTVTEAGETLQFNEPVYFETVTGARVVVRGYEDGRRDLLGGRRYRR